MSKELTPLESFERIKNITYDRTDLYGIEEYRKSLDIIETALKEKENIEKTINELFSENGKVITTIDIKKQLKAFEIIKDKGVDVLKLKECKRCKKPDEYNKRTCYSYHNELTQEEYDLLKEVLL